MALSELLIPVSSETAAAYMQASDQQRLLAVQVFESFMKPMTKEEGLAAFFESRRRLAAQAAEQGMTSEDLESILSDEP